MKNNIRLPSPSDLAAFQVIAQAGNLSRAAERLGVGQPALSLVVKRLEELLETPLFLRRNRGLTLTSSGERLLKKAGELQEDWARLVSETKSLREDLRATFRLGCHASVAHYALNPFVNDSYRKFPGIQFELVHGLSREIGAGVISGSIDFGFVVNPLRHPDLIIKKIATDEVAFWSAAGHNKDVLICDPNMIDARAPLKKSTSKFKRIIRTTSLELIATLASSGAGTAILPTRIAQILAPTLKRVPGMETFRDEVTFVYRQDSPQTAAVKAVLEQIRSLKI